MKKKLVFSLFILLIIANIFLLSAQATQATIANETQKVDKAYSCLQEKTNTTAKCSSLSTEEKIFSVLAAGRCRQELSSSSANNGQCWTSNQGDSICRVKTTAQAILALKNANQQATAAQDWLLLQNKSTTELIWYLQVDNTEGSEAATCSVEYNLFSYSFSIDSEKKLSDDAGPCLTRAEGGYWFQVSPTCYNVEFKTSCNQNFQTSLLFTKATSPSTIHVTSETHGASAEGETTEKIESYCFAENNICNYEGTLWATLVLKSLNKPISAYLPYLIIFAEDNPRALPDSFLYFITKETSYRNSLLAQQIDNKWWSESGDRYYDTALAMYPFSGQTLQEKTSAKQWLLDVQGANGCWQDNTRNTAFILASIWPKTISGDGGGGTPQLPSCTSANYYCVSSGSCEGQILSSQYSCPVLSECCTTQATLPSCLEFSGSSNNICASGQVCQGGNFISSSDSLNQRCCVGGTCVTPTIPTYTCQTNNGTCRTSGSGCQNNEKASTAYTCEFSSDVCCLPEATPKGNYTWIWILTILIILVVIGIIFRDKLRNLWLKMGSGKGKPGPAPAFGRRPFPPSTPYYPRPRPIERRILVQPQQKPRPILKPIKSAATKELDEVLRKLKEMGK